MRRKNRPVTEQPFIRLGDTQKIISDYHTLNKNLQVAIKQNDSNEIMAIQQKLSLMGGLETYQRASLKGGSIRKGFSASGKWILPFLQKERRSKAFECSNDHIKLKMLDVGAITGEVYVKYSFLDVISIDLNSQSPRVVKQDFFDRPIPKSKQDCFDVLCLSLVLNFIGDVEMRGLMLLRCRDHITDSGLLYIVLPLSCIQNSRFMTHASFISLMRNLQFVVEEFSFSKKLCYYLFRIDRSLFLNCHFSKAEVNPGPKRNNFSIVLNRSSESIMEMSTFKKNQ